MNDEKIWQTVLGELEVVLSKANFTTWFKDTFILSNKDGLAIIGVPNLFTLNWLKNKYNHDILETLKKYSPSLKSIQYKVSDKSLPLVNDIRIQTETKIESNTLAADNYVKTDNLNGYYTFDNFVVGNSNRLAHATSIAVATSPGKKYNPLFIYGGVGLGKTHLAQAIGNEIVKKNPKKKIIYAPCEHFANEFVDAIQNKKINQFKKKYRDADVLLIDDIQFLSAKEGTQEEFFHTFNALHQSNRQVVLTSDRLPQAIPELAGRLSSRFAGGMVADIKQPDFETRSAILKAKCQKLDYPLDTKSISYIAEHVTANIRELEGALNKIKTHCDLYNISPSMDAITKILDDYIANKSRNINPAKIFKTIADFFSIKMEDLLGHRRNKELVYPRQISMYLLRHEANYSYPKIGKELGGKDHTTVMHGVEKIEKEITKNDRMQQELSLIKEKLYL